MADISSPAATLVDSEAGAPEICNSCRRLDLRLSKFIINKIAFSKVQHETSSIGFSRREYQKNLRPTGDPKITLGSISDVQRNQDSCRLCGLISRAVAKYSSGKTSDEHATLSLTWEVDGRQMKDDNRLINRTRRLRVTWNRNDGTEQDVYLVLMAPEGTQQTNSDAYAASATARHFLGRGLVEPREKQSLIKSWIDLCVKDHGENCQLKHGSSQDFKKLVKGTHFGVVDVIDMCLKELPFNAEGEPESYVALSYVWGKRHAGSSAYTTVRANVMLHIQHGGIEKVWDRLPRTIQDAILLTSKLGERYIWIDSLCIVQDSVTSWELNATAMHLVYGNAHVTICAADGDAGTGLLAVQSLLRSNSSSSMRDGPGTIDADSLEISGPRLTAECLPGVRLLVVRSPEAVIQDSDWNKRGWTFQERLLSPRCLLFVEGHVYFQCRSTVMSQDIFTDGGISGWSLDRTNAPLKTLGELERRAFWFYMTCIRLYTGRDLSQPNDILTAFQGTSWLLKQRMNAPLLYGLPTSHFDLSLLWSPMNVLTRRTNYNRLLAVGKDDQEFPSWSWCGWTGGKSQYRADMIEGCLINVHEWLVNHTWICWYFRDREGNLRPLRDRNVSVEDVSEDARWKGYCGIPAHKRRVPKSSNSPQGTEGTVRFEPEARKNRPRGRRQRAQHKVRFRPDPPASIDRRGPERPHAGLRESSSHTEWIRMPNTPYVDRLGGVPVPFDNYNASVASPWLGNLANGSGPAQSRPSSIDPRDRAQMPSSYSFYANESVAAPLDLGERVARYLQPSLRGASVQGSYYPHDMHHAMNRRAMPPHRVASYRPYHSPPLFDPAFSVDSDESGESDDSSDNYISASETIDDQFQDARQPSGGRSTSYVQPSKKIHVQPESLGHDELDPYGRRQRYPGKPRTTFKNIIPDNPFGVVRGPLPSDEEVFSRAMPILQFWTWQTTLLVRLAGMQEESTPGVDGLLRHNILDKAGDWCGSIDLPGSWTMNDPNSEQMFIAISDARAFTRDECTTWNYYIPKERDESEWDLYYVLLLRRNSERALWERVGLGKVFQAAFGHATWEEIKLG